MNLPRIDLLSLRRYIDNEYMEDGYAVIHINLYQEYELFDPLSYGRQKQINQEIIDYIDRRSAIIPTTIPLKVIFHGKDITEDDQENIKKCIKEHYTVAMYDKQWDKRINRRKIIALTALGLSVLGVYVLHAISGEENMRTEILSIIASFSLWEAVDLFLLERKSLQKELWDLLKQILKLLEGLN